MTLKHNPLLSVNSLQSFQQQIEERLASQSAASRLIDSDAETFAAQYLYVLDKKRQQKRLLYNDAQRALMNNLTGRDLVLKARQLGISSSIQGYFAHMAWTHAVATMTLSHEDKTTQKLRRMSDHFYYSLPKNQRPLRKYSNASVTTYPLLFSEAEIATAGNTSSGRGGTYTHFHGSEVAFWVDAEAVIAGAMQGGNPEVILESTPNGAQGYFYNLCMEALDGNSDWRLHFFPWWIDPEYQIALDEGETLTYSDDEQSLIEKHRLTPQQIKWRRSKQRTLKHLFPQEYAEDAKSCFLLSGGGYFGDLSHCYKAPRNVVRYSEHRYVAGLDWGQQNDYTVLSVFDATARVQVDLLRINRLEWAEMRKRIREMCKRWQVSTLWAEQNSASTNVESLRNEFRADQLATKVLEFVTTNSSKASAAGDFYEALHSGGALLLDDTDQRRELAAFRANQLPSGGWKLEAPKGEHDDIPMADIIAWHGVLHTSTAVYEIA